MLRQMLSATIGMDRARAIKRATLAPLKPLTRSGCSALHRHVLNPINRARHARRSHRCLEIGPGAGIYVGHITGNSTAGFETVDVFSHRGATYVADASRRLPFATATFDLVYASHIIEHVPWYQVDMTLKEWVRVLKPGGRLEVWTPNGLRIAKAFVEAEERACADFHADDWWRMNEQRDPCLWAAGRMFSYGDGTGTANHENWHRSLFSPRFLRSAFAAAGLADIREMDRAEVRTHDHGWINLGVCGMKPS